MFFFIIITVPFFSLIIFGLSATILLKKKENFTNIYKSVNMVYNDYLLWIKKSIYYGNFTLIILIFPGKFQHEDLYLTMKEDGTYQCTICDRIYSLKRTAKRHIHENHIDNDPVQCKICEAVLKTRRGLTKHMKKCHSNIGMENYNGEWWSCHVRITLI